jgi:hypothetical protein
MPKYSPAFRKAACAVLGRILWDLFQLSISQMEDSYSYISGSVTPRSLYAFCLAPKQAIRIDSVPPLVVTPAAPSGA